MIAYLEGEIVRTEPILIVLKTSSDKSRLDICVTPFEIAGIIIDLCEIDLSPGIFMVPLIPLTIFELTSIKF